MKKGGIQAKVQGSVKTPYKVTIQIKPFQQKQWEKIINRMSQKALFAAKLLAGEMPDKIEDLLEEININLFPKARKDLETKCSCPDSANPCKHIAAVHYILAEEFDRDPFMIFALRGKNKNEISKALRKIRTNSIKKPLAGNKGIEQKQDEGKVNEPKVSQKQSASISEFWTGSASEPFSLNIKAPKTSLSIIKRLGVPSFWDVNKDFMVLMEEFYTQISQKAIMMLTRDTEGEETPYLNGKGDNDQKPRPISKESDLIKLFEEETGKHAIWRGRETKNYLKWKKKEN